MKLIIPLLFSLLFLSFGVAAGEAQECQVDLRNDFRVSSKFLEVSSGGEILYQVSQGGQLRINNEEVELNAAQRARLEAYAGDTASLASQWVEFVSETLKQVSESLYAAFGEAFGEDSPAAVQSSQAVARAREKFDLLTRSEDGVYTVSEALFDDLGAVLGQDIREAVGATVRNLLLELGKTVKSTEGSFGERMEAFGLRMEAMGRELEQMGLSLETTSAEMCAELEALQALERQLAKEIPQLAPYPLLSR